MASVIGISTHPFKKNARALSAEMTGYMSERNELGAGIRYSHQINRSRILDFTISGAQNSRKMNAGAGVDFELLREDIYQPRVSVKSFLQYQKFEFESSNLLGFAPTLRKGFSLNGHELFPYIATPMGIKVNNVTDEFVSYASVTLGASMPVPKAKNDKILLSLEGNKNLGASADSIGFLISWIWK
jgi:hypothetical protein